jgi:hypothetical protein
VRVIIKSLFIISIVLGVAVAFSSIMSHRDKPVLVAEPGS